MSATRKSKSDSVAIRFTERVETFQVIVKGWFERPIEQMFDRKTLGEIAPARFARAGPVVDVDRPSRHLDCLPAALRNVAALRINREIDIGD